jgi:nitrous oxide reductase accessory protein NosL
MADMRSIIILLIIPLLFLAAQKQQRAAFTKAAETEHFVQLQSGPTQDWCPICGMHLQKFYKTNHATTPDNGQARQFCSLRCLGVALAEQPFQTDSLRVVDAASDVFIPVDSAYYLIGSGIPGTMTKVSKLAFASAAEADFFRQRHGGTAIVSFDSALVLAQTQRRADDAILMQKKEMLVIPKGRKLFAKYCGEQMPVGKFASVAELKAHLRASGNCGEVSQDQLHMIAIYLFSATEQRQIETTVFRPKEDTRCPVCGMFVAKYPRWLAKIASGEEQEDLYFDGVKDMLKYYFNEGDGAVGMKQLWVTEYYSQTPLSASAALFVIGSDVLGPMGKELIPLADRQAAETFMRDHGGQIVASFNDISPALLESLDD